MTTKLLLLAALLAATPASAVPIRVDNPPTLVTISGADITPASVSATTITYGDSSTQGVLQANGAIVSKGSVTVTGAISVSTAGIGTTAPKNTLQVNGTAAAPVSSGNDVESGIFRVQNNLSVGLDFGGYALTPFASWIQSTATNDHSYTFPLVLNPLGGNVGIGITAPASKLSIEGTGAATLTTPAYWLSVGGTGAQTYTNGYYYGMGLGFNGTHSPAFVGFNVTSSAGNTKGDLVFATRDATTDSAPTERARLTAAGDFAFGSGATKSTFSATGFLTITGSTLTVASSGIITAPSQPSAGVQLVGAQSVISGASLHLYWGEEDWDQGGIHDNSVSSDTITALAAGVYSVVCQVEWASSAVGARQLIIGKNAAVVKYAYMAAIVSGIHTQNISTQLSLAASDTVYCAVDQTSGGPLNVNDTTGTFFSMTKLW